MSIVIISGPPGAGKSTVADALCERYDRTVHLCQDDVQGWLRMGFIPPYKPESFQQTLTIGRAAGRAAVSFARDQYGVFIEGVIGPDTLDVLVEELREAAVAIHHAKLLPTAAALIERFHNRPQANALGTTDEMLAQVRDMFAGWTMPGIVIDNTSMTAHEAADAIMAACGTGEANVWTP